MERKQLNLSAPLLSARRYSSPLRSSLDDTKHDSTNQGMNVLISHQSDEVVKPGTVPFMWEQIPGKAKGWNESHKYLLDEFSSIPKLPPGRAKSGEINGSRTPNKLSGELNLIRSRMKLSGELHIARAHSKLSEELGALRTLNGGLDTKKDRDSDSEKEGTSFSDALDTFSQLGSSSMNCSISGLSGQDCSGIEPSGSFYNDPKARDFMMNRFLPAAKAMTVEPTQYSSKKQPEQRSLAIIPRAQTPPPSRNVCSIVPYTGQDIGSQESEDEDEEEDDNYDNHSGISVKIKACGFFPWLCAKNYLHRINPVPAVKVGTKTALSSASKVGRLMKNASLKSSKQTILAKHVPCATHKRKVDPVSKSCELRYVENQQKVKPKPMFYSGELQSRSGSPYRNRGRDGASPYRSESPRSLYHKGVGVLAVPKNSDRSNDTTPKSYLNDPKKRNTRGLGSASHVVEKTLYIDSVNIRKVSHSLLATSKAKRLQADASVNETESFAKDKVTAQNVLAESSGPYGQRSDIGKARGINRPLVSGSSKLQREGNVNTSRELIVRADDTQAPLTPPLPKSPSESWLSRNLPSVSPRNSFSHAHFGSKIQTRKSNGVTPAAGAKWETIVKSSHLRHDLGRYSEELVARVAQPPLTRK